MLSIGTMEEVMLSQIINIVVSFAPDVKVVQLQTSLAHILSAYEIRPLQDGATHPDLQDKIGLFLAAKQLEGCSKSTIKSYGIELRTFAGHVRKAAEDIATADIRAYLGGFPQHKTSSISSKLSILKSFFGWLAMEEILERDPSRKLKLPKKEKRLPKALSIDELKKLREGCKTLRQRAVIEALYATGCRLSEIIGLDRDGIDWANQSAYVIGKGNKEREVYFSDKALRFLRKYLMSRLDDCPALFVTERKPHRRASGRAIQREVEIIAMQAGLVKNIHPHILRHTFATHFLNNGASLSAVQELLGHEDPATTQIYSQLTDERKKAQYKKYHVQ